MPPPDDGPKPYETILPLYATQTLEAYRQVIQCVLRCCLGEFDDCDSEGLRDVERVGKADAEFNGEEEWVDGCFLDEYEKPPPLHRFSCFGTKYLTELLYVPPFVEDSVGSIGGGGVGGCGKRRFKSVVSHRIFRRRQGSRQSSKQERSECRCTDLLSKCVPPIYFSQMLSPGWFPYLVTQLYQWTQRMDREVTYQKLELVKDIWERVTGWQHDSTDLPLDQKMRRLKPMSCLRGLVFLYRVLRGIQECGESTDLLESLWCVNLVTERGTLWSTIKKVPLTSWPREVLRYYVASLPVGKLLSPEEQDAVVDNIILLQWPHYAYFKPYRLFLKEKEPNKKAFLEVWRTIAARKPPYTSASALTEEAEWCCSAAPTLHVSQCWSLILKFNCLFADKCTSSADTETLLDVGKRFGWDRLHQALDGVVEKIKHDAEQGGEWRSRGGVTLVEIVDLLMDYRSSYTTFDEAVLTTLRSDEIRSVDEWLRKACALVNEGAFASESVVLTRGAMIKEIARESVESGIAHLDSTLEEAFRLWAASHEGGSAVYAYLFDQRTGNRDDSDVLLCKWSHLRNKCSNLKSQSISKWSLHEISNWAVLFNECRRELPDLANSRCDHGTIFPILVEVATVIMHAAEVYFKKTLRETQRAAVLLLFLYAGRAKNALAQILTGQGKTLIHAILAACCAMVGRTVDVVVSSPVLALRDATEMEGFYKVFNNMTVGALSHEQRLENSMIAYKKTVVYGSADDFIGDVLRTSFTKHRVRAGRPCDLCLIDEVDSLLYDQRSASVRLSEPSPSTSHLLPLLAVMWRACTFNHNHLVLDSDDGKYYFIQGKFTVYNGRVDIQGDLEETIEGSKAADGNSGETDETPQAKNSPPSYENTRIELKDSVNVWLKKSIILATKSITRDLWKEEANEEGVQFTEGQNILHVPVHLQDFVRSNITKLAESAVEALLHYEKGKHYVVVEDKIVPVDYENAGVLQHNTVWGRGLHQFLQMKESLPVDPPTFVSCFLSYVGYFKQYNRIIGASGTLGSAPTQDFLHRVYDLNMLIIPPFKRLVHAPEEEPWGSGGAGPSKSRYLAKELEPVVTADAQGVLEVLITKSSRIARGGRPVLIIVETINDVKFICQYMNKAFPALRTHANTGEAEFSVKKVGPGEVIVATNIAGRGADYEPTEDAEKNGGLHVSVGFMPENSRVELQNAGRTSRQGRRGTVQLFFPGLSPGGTANEVRLKRDQMEKERLRRARYQVEGMRFRDHLLKMFCNLVSEVLTGNEGQARQKFLIEVTQARKHWIQFVEHQMSGKLYEAAWERYRKEHAPPPAPSSRQEAEDDAGRDSNKILEVLKSQFDREREAQAQERFRKASKKSYSDDVLEEVFAGKEVCAQVDAADTECYEGKALKERFALWLEALPVELGDLDNRKEVLDLFEDFCEEVRSDARRGERLIRNPHYYICMGNRLLQEERAGKAAEAYDAAIQLDPHFCYLAYYYKGMALLKSSSTAYDKAREAFANARKLIEEVEVSDVTLFVSFLSKPGAEKTITNGVHFANVYRMHMSLIDQCLESLKKCKEDNKEVVVLSDLEGSSTMYELVPGSNDPILRDVLDRLSCDGLQWIYMLQERKEIPWRSALKLLVLGAAQLALGAVLMYYGGGGGLSTAFIQGGITDLFKCGETLITKNEVDWNDYCIQKAVSGITCVILSGPSAIGKELGCFGTNTTCPDFGKLNGIGGSFSEAFLKTFKDEAMKHVGNAAASYVVDSFAENVHLGWNWLEPKVREAVQSSTKTFVYTNNTVKLCIKVDVANQNFDWEWNLREGAKYVSHKEMRTTRFVVSDIPGLKEVFTNPRFRDFLDGVGKNLSAAFLPRNAKPVVTGLKAMWKTMEVTQLPERFYGKYGEYINQGVFKESLERSLADVKAKAESDGTRAKCKSVELSEKGQANSKAALNSKTENPDYAQVIEPHRKPSLGPKPSNLPSIPEAGSAKANSGEFYSSEGPDGPCQAEARTEEKIKVSLTEFLEGHLMESTRSVYDREVLGFVCKQMEGDVVNYMCRDLTEEAREARGKHLALCGAHACANRAPPRPRGGGKNKKPPTKKEQDITDEEVNQILNGEEGDFRCLSCFFHEKRLWVQVVDGEGHLLASAGSCYRGEPIVLKRYRVLGSEENGVERYHYEAANPKDGVRDGFSGKNDCLYTALSDSLTPEQKESTDIWSAADGRREVAKCIQSNPKYHGQMTRCLQELEKYNKDAFLRGGAWGLPTLNWPKWEDVKDGAIVVFEKGRGIYEAYCSLPWYVHVGADVAIFYCSGGGSCLQQLRAFGVKGMLTQEFFIKGGAALCVYYSRKNLQYACSTGAGDATEFLMGKIMGKEYAEFLGRRASKKVGEKCGDKLFHGSAAEERKANRKQYDCKKGTLNNKLTKNTEKLNKGRREMRQANKNAGKTGEDRKGPTKGQKKADKRVTKHEREKVKTENELKDLHASFEKNDSELRREENIDTFKDAVDELPKEQDAEINKPADKFEILEKCYDIWRANPKDRRRMLRKMGYGANRGGVVQKISDLDHWGKSRLYAGTKTLIKWCSDKYNSRVKNDRVSSSSDADDGEKDKKPASSPPKTCDDKKKPT